MVRLRLAPCRHCLGSPAGNWHALFGKLGWVVVAQKGSHAQLKNPSRGGRVTVPLHAGETIGPGLLRSILSQAGVTVEQLRAVL
jgi:predicted RNA binding protein YcfA (HicA-like mRNA interferase family)